MFCFHLSKCENKICLQINSLIYQLLKTCLFSKCLVDSHKYQNIKCAMLTENDVNLKEIHFDMQKLNAAKLFCLCVCVCVCVRKQMFW